MGGKKIYIILFILLVFLQAFDVWSTGVIIGNDPSMEFNPLMRGLMYRFGVVGAPVIGKSLIMLAMAFVIWVMKTERDRRAVMGGLLIINSFCVGALVSANLQMLLMI